MHPSMNSSMLRQPDLRDEAARVVRIVIIVRRRRIIVVVVVILIMIVVKIIICIIIRTLIRVNDDYINDISNNNVAQMRQCSHDTRVQTQERKYSERARDLV